MLTEESLKIAKNLKKPWEPHVETVSFNGYFCGDVHLR